MAPPRALASYKKQNGVIAISKDRKSVSWSPAQPPDASPTLVVSATNVTNLQQTPESSAKVMLKVFAQNPGQTEPVAHVFTFISQTDARAEANAIKDALANVIQAQKTALSAESNATAGHSAAMTIANAISGNSRIGNSWEDDERLKSDVKLQQSLMQEDPNLQKTFMEAVRLKPDSISTTQFTAQFWSSRVHLLRAHAIAQSQGRGRYNVFSELRREDGGRKMNLTQDHVRTIFDQYPAVRRVYDEVVPRMIKSEMEFWSRFFQSKLFMTLRGLKFDAKKEAEDKILDRFLTMPELTGARPTPAEMHIPKFIDLEGNEENHSQRKGNRPDQELRESTLDKAPIIRKLNALSEKLMAAVRPSDVDASAPIGMEEAEYEQLRLRDLEGDPAQNRIMLNIRDQSRFFSDSRSDENTEANPFRNLDAAEAIRSVSTDITSHFSQPGVGEISIDSYPDGEDEKDDGTELNSENSGSILASEHIFSLIQAHRNQTSEIHSTSGLSQDTYNQITITHATTIEFLRQFWNAFLSGDPSRANEASSLIESLNRALDRINAIADEAEKDRNDTIKSNERQAEELSRKTGRKRKVDYAAIGGGAKVVRELLGPITKSLASAVARYKQAFEEQTKAVRDVG